jgi:8-oxo-dGTP diphosphatase
MAGPIAVAVVINDAKSDRVLLVRRPEEPGEDFAGMWGLPAATLGEGESVEAAVERMGRQKLGIGLTPGGELHRGLQLRGDSTLEMVLVEAEARDWPPALRPASAGSASTHYTDWTWGDTEMLRPTAELGSLCARLYLELSPGSAEAEA